MPVVRLGCLQLSKETVEFWKKGFNAENAKKLENAGFIQFMKGGEHVPATPYPPPPCASSPCSSSLQQKAGSACSVPLALSRHSAPSLVLVCRWRGYAPVGEYHGNNPEMSKLLHKAVRNGEADAYLTYQAHINQRPTNVSARVHPGRPQGRLPLCGPGRRARQVPAAAASIILLHHSQRPSLHMLPRSCFWHSVGPCRCCHCAPTEPKPVPVPALVLKPMPVPAPGPVPVLVLVAVGVCGSGAEGSPGAALGP